MSNIRKFHVKHSDDVVSFDVELDMSSKASLSLENYEVKTYGDSIKSDIVAMSTFWGGSPSNDADFEKHLEFFLKIMSRTVATIAIEKTDHPSNIHALMNEAEGYYPCFGRGINILNVSAYEYYLVDGISMEEVK